MRRPARAEVGVHAKTGQTREAVPGDGGGDGTQAGDPAKAAALIRAPLDAPLRLPLGDDAVSAVVDHLDGVWADVTAWEKSTRATGFDD